MVTYSKICLFIIICLVKNLVGGISHPLEAESGDCTPLLELGLLTTEHVARIGYMTCGRGKYLVWRDTLLVEMSS